MHLQNICSALLFEVNIVLSLQSESRQVDAVGLGDFQFLIVILLLL